jgi:site-specific DNA recombinase
MKAYLIARVSTEDQIDALPAQVYRLKDYAELNDYDYELVEITESAYKLERSKFRKFLEELKSEKHPFILVFDKIDRYTRDSSSEEVQIMKKLYRSGKAELHFPSDNLKIHRESPAADLMRLGMGEVVSQYYSDSISDNVKRRFEQKLRDGEWIGQAPLGYKNVDLPNEKKWVEIDAFKAEAVRSAFEWYASGNYSLKLVRDKLKAEFALELGISQLDKVLKNPFYHGEMLVKSKLYSHKYDTVIGIELYKQAEAVRQGYKAKPHRWGGLPYAYRGLISCASCGCRITFEKKKGKYTYGHCTQYRGKHGAEYINEDSITKQLMSVFQGIQIPEVAYQEVSIALRSAQEDKKALRLRTLRTLDAEIEKYQKRMDKVYEDYLDEIITEPLYKRKFEQYRKAQKALQNKRVNIDQIEDDYFATVNHLLTLAKKAPESFKKANIEQKRSLINLVLSNLQLKGKELRWELKKPFDTMVFCSENGNWLRGLDSNQRPRR